MDGEATEPDGEDVRTDVCVIGAARPASPSPASSALGASMSAS